MKKLFLIALVWCYCLQIMAQNVGLNLSGGIRKDITLHKKMELQLSQRLSFTPELEPLEVDYDDFFDDFDLLPGTENDDDDDDDDDSEDDDDDDDDDEQVVIPGSSTGDPDAQILDASARSLVTEIRSATTAKLNWKMKKWLRIFNEYSFNWRPGRVRHAYETSIRLEPDLLGKKWRLYLETSFQHVGETKKKGFEISSGAASRLQLQYRLTKAHQVYSSVGVNSDLEEGQLEWDRFRVDGGLRYEFKDRHQFQLGYRFQQRINGKGDAAHDLNFGYLYHF